MNRRRYLRTVGVGATVATVGVGSASAAGATGQVVFIYDDSMKTDYSMAFKVHEDEGVPGCSAAIAASVVPNRPHMEFMGPKKLREMADSGWEVMSHSLFHRYWDTQHIQRDLAPDDTKIYLPSQILGNFANFKLRVSDGDKKTIVTTVGAGKDENGNYVKLKDQIGTAYSVSDGTTVRYPNDQVKDMMSRSRKMLEDKTGATVHNLVWPYGGHGDYVDSLVPKYFNGVGNFHIGGMNSRENFDPYHTNRAQFSRDAMTDYDMSKYFDKVAKGNKLGVLGGHTHYKSFDKDRIRTAIQMAKKRDIEIVTFQQAIEDNATMQTSTPTPTPTQTPTHPDTNADPDVDADADDVDGDDHRSLRGSRKLSEEIRRRGHLRILRARDRGHSPPLLSTRWCAFSRRSRQSVRRRKSPSQTRSLLFREWVLVTESNFFHTSSGRNLLYRVRRPCTCEMAVLWLDEIRAVDLETVGGKAASLGELTAAGLPVPPGFVVTAETYRAFIEDAGIDDELFEAVDIDHEDSGALAEAQARAHDLIMGTDIPEDVRQEILDSYRSIGDDGEEAFVAVRSSATAEDLPDASFAGQQETFLNVTEEKLLERVKECWASLFSQRAIYYRNRQGFPHAEVDIAVVVQQMVDAEKSGVMFTSHPSTGEPRIIIEAAWGLGEAVVSGAVSPDNYVVDRESASVDDVTIATKKVMHVKNNETGETEELAVPDGKRDARVLSEEEIAELVELGRRVEDHYGEPQDVEWAITDGSIYMLQSRPITTINEQNGVEVTEAAGDGSGSEQAVGNGGGSVAESTESTRAGGNGDVLLKGLGASPGIASGPARIIRKLDQLDKVGEGDVIVTEMTMPDMVPAMKRAAGIVTDEGGMTSHAAIVSRELGVPAVVGTGSATRQLEDGQVITLDGDKGTIRAGEETPEEEEREREPVEEMRPKTPVKPMTATEVKVNVSIPEAAERAAATGADGVGLLRMEHMVLSLGKTPQRYIEQNGAKAYVDEIVDGIRHVAEEFYPRPVRVRTLDAPTDEFRQMEGGENEPNEHNPMLGYRGIRRSLDNPEIFEHELEAFRRLYDMGYDNVEVMLPLVNDAEDVYRAKALMEQAGVDPAKREWGVMIETPASALSVESMAEAGISFASFGTNDLTQYTLAVDRNNENVANRFDELHPAVLELIGTTIEKCREHDVKTSICGQAGSKPKMVQFLVDAGVSSISANIDAVRDVQHEVKRVEQKLLLESVRK